MWLWSAEPLTVSEEKWKKHYSFVSSTDWKYWLKSEAHLPPAGLVMCFCWKPHQINTQLRFRTTAGTLFFLLPLIRPLVSIIYVRSRFGSLYVKAQ